MAQYTTVDDIEDIVISREDNSNYEYPPFGDHQAVLCDIIDLGMEESEWQGKKSMKHKIRLVFQLECENGERRKDGSRFTVSKKFTRSLYQSALLDFLTQWRGRAFTDEELDAFRMKSLYGANASLTYGELPSKMPGGKTYKGIVAIAKWNTKLGPVITPDKYIREDYKKKDSDAAPASTTNNHAKSTTKHDDEDIPF